MENTVYRICATVSAAALAASLLGAPFAVVAQGLDVPDDSAPAAAVAPGYLPAADLLSPFAAALSAALPDDAAAAYAERAYAPFWIEDGRAAILIAALRQADTHALPPARYAADALAAPTPGDDAGRARHEAALATAFLRYARDVNSGALEPRRIARDIKVSPERPNPAALLRAAALATDLAAFLDSLAPQTADYAGLRQAYGRMTALAGEATWGPTVPAGPTLRPGERGPRIAALRARLAAKGHPSEATDPALFDRGLEAAVRRFQAQAGLIVDGAVGPATLGAVNAGPAERAAQIAVNLERARWLNRPLGDRRIMVNLPDFTVQLIDDGRVLFDERTVVGLPDRQTPEFSDEMDHLVLNPTWYVPRSIATRDLLPQLQADPVGFVRRGMRLQRTDGGEMPEDIMTHDFSVYTQANFPYRIRQAPSDDNALGAVKFMFPNDDAIYLHDTPRRSLFNRDIRAFSSGCVRVRDPMRLAELLFAPQMDDPRGFIDGVLRSGRERTVTLERKVPIHLIYRTAFVDVLGAVQFRADVYGRDALVLRALRDLGLETPES
jgi:murein L,D-transpeptidase YcbB/YkuD